MASLTFQLEVTTPSSWTAPLSRCDDPDRLKAFAAFAIEQVKRPTRELRTSEASLRVAESPVAMKAVIKQICQDIEDESKEMAFWGDKSVPTPAQLHATWAAWWTPPSTEEEDASPKLVAREYVVRDAIGSSTHYNILDAVAGALKCYHRHGQDVEVRRGIKKVLCLHDQLASSHFTSHAEPDEIHIIELNFPNLRGIRKG